MQKQPIHTDNAPAAIGTYSQAIRCGSFVFLSGQIPLVPATMEVVTGDFAARARQVFSQHRGGRAGRRRQPQRCRQSHRFPDGPRQLRYRQRGHGRVFRAALPGTCRRRRCVSAERRRHRGRRDPCNLILRSQTCRASARRLQRNSGSSGCFASKTCFFCCRCATRIVRSWSGSARWPPATRCLVSGEVLLAETVYRGRRNLLVRISDGSGQLTLRFFHFSRQQQAQFQPGARISCFGEVRRGSAGFEMIHPEYRILRDSQDALTNDALTPIYPATEGVQQGRLRNLTDQALRFDAAGAARQSSCRPASRSKLGMPSLADAIGFLHRPPPDADVQQMHAGASPVPATTRFRGAARALPEPAQPAGTRRHRERRGADRGSQRREPLHRRSAFSSSPARSSASSMKFSRTCRSRTR